MASQTYPSGLAVSYAPNAQGQPTQAGSYATGVSWYPNGALKAFTYGNGMVHTATQNARGRHLFCRQPAAGPAVRLRRQRQRQPDHRPRGRRQADPGHEL